jgi:Skp family chaperone for outer membrane proteins
MTKPTDEAILHTLRKIEDRQASMDSDMEKDRQELQNLNIRIQNLEQSFETEIREIRKAVNQTALRTRDRVAEAVEPIINSTEKLTTQIKKKRMVVLKEKVGWFERLFREK